MTRMHIEVRVLTTHECIHGVCMIIRRKNIMSSNNKIYSISRKNDRKILDYEDIESEIQKANSVYLDRHPDIIYIHDSISMMYVKIS